MTDIPDVIRHLIVDKVKKGESQRKVALQLNMGVSTVNQIVERYLLTGSIDNRHRSVRPQKTTEEKEGTYVNFQRRSLLVLQDNY